MNRDHGVVLYRNGTSIRISWDEAQNLIEELGGKRRIHRPAQSNYLVAHDPFDGTRVLIDKSLISMIHMWTEDGLEGNLEFHRHIQNRKEDYFGEGDGGVPNDWGPGA